jgi:two-component system sensor histidine kinase DctS
VFTRLGRAERQADVSLACTNARRISAPAYSASYFVPQMDGLGVEVMELCMPQLAIAGRSGGLLVATYSLQEILADWWASR